MGLFVEHRRYLDALLEAWMCTSGLPHNTFFSSLKLFAAVPSGR
jgi:hypothetical protein